MRRYSTTNPACWKQKYRHSHKSFYLNTLLHLFCGLLCWWVQWPAAAFAAGLQEPAQADAGEWIKKAEDLIGTDRDFSSEQAEYYEKALAADPTIAEAHFNLVLIYRRLGRLDAALPHAEALIKLLPNDPRGYAAAAALQLELGDKDAATTLLEKVVQLDPDDYRAWEELGRLYFESGRYERAVTAFQRVLDLNPSPVEAYFNLGLAQQRIGDFTGAAESFRKFLAVFPNDFHARFLLGLCYRHLEKREQALEEFLAAEKIDPDQPELARELGYLLLELGREAEAAIRLRRIAEGDPRILSDLGYIAQRQNDREAAASYFQRSLALDSNQPEVWGRLGDVLSALQRGREAQAAYEKAISLNPEDFDSLLNLGALLANQQDWTAAEPMLRRALEVRPDSGEAHYYLGVVLEHQGAWREALNEYQTALQSGYDSAPLHFRLGILHARAEHGEAALHHLSLAFERDPGKYVPLVVKSLQAVHNELDSIRYTDAFNRLLDQYREYWQPKP